MEYFDVVDKNKIKTGKILPRGSKMNFNEYNIGVEAWIINSDSQLLLTQRSTLKSHPLQWECPGGCSISGESSQETIIRELKEEIGIDVLINDLRFITTDLYKSQFVDIYLLKLHINIEKLILQKEEIENAKLVTFPELIKLNSENKIVPSVYARYELIKDYLINNKKY